MTAMKLRNKLFAGVGAHVLIDGQYGSTGKGALAAWLAVQAHNHRVQFEGAITSAGPNSGHTFYDSYDNKHVLKQLPTFAVMANMLGGNVTAYLSGGAVINLDILIDEAERYPETPIRVHENAAVIKLEDVIVEKHGSIAKIASTISGTGAAQMRKINREPDAVFKHYWETKKFPPNVGTFRHPFHADAYRYFVEVAQGFSLGINGRFYPHTTSRECTVMQGIADARIPPSCVAKTYMAIRTYPIRVGNLGENSSGDWYEDQKEMAWTDLGVEPELTTVTQRIRRVASFSVRQLIEATIANDPNFLFINFLNYLPPDERVPFVEELHRIRDQMNFGYDILGGMGPKLSDIEFV